MVMALASIDVVMMLAATLNANLGTIIVMIAGMLVCGWMVVAITITISTNPNCHSSRTNVNVLSHSGCGACEG